MLTYRCNDRETSGPVKMIGKFFSVGRNGWIDGVYPIGVNLWVRELASNHWRWRPKSMIEIDPVVLITGVKLEEVALNAVLLH